MRDNVKARISFPGCIIFASYSIGLFLVFSGFQRRDMLPRTDY